jgi:hypothetical protein
MKRWTILLLLTLTGCGTMGYPQSKAQRLQEYQQQNPNATPEVLAKIRAGQVSVGMTMGDVLAAWGQPRYSSKSSDGTAQWVYGEPGYGATYLHFQGTTLESWTGTEQ